ncbi:lipase member H-B-like [Anoplolepis gracilipes]|uniref:lipase member H-B-like n=1 Tax=Anoplolepis gracilipes TaxID=354296 RepID=UPI003B9DF529
MAWSASAYICLLLSIFFFTSAESNSNKIDDIGAAEIDADKILLSFYTCNATDPTTSIDCRIQDINCTENAYNLLSTGKNETTIFLHGYHRNREPMLNIISAYCSKNTSVVALFDWTQLQPEIVSLSVTNWTSTIGKIAAPTFGALKNKGYNVGTWHLVGHSMGVHIAGCIAKYTNFSWSHITGLDPAGTVFYTNMYEGCQITPESATFTEMFYTDVNGYGINEKVGTLNIYANTGTAPQPGCYSAQNIRWCSHFKAIEWYADSVRNETKYVATKCENCLVALDFYSFCEKNNRVYLGPRVNNEASGQYCVAID